MPHYDLVVIGGGINGAGIAADAAGRGLSVALFEANDLASATSSASSKLIHGGLRYLEHYEFRLVKEALAERETLLNMAPHITRPMRFRLPHRPHLRPAWMIRAGLFLYDHLAKRVTLPACRSVRFSANDGLQPQLVKGFEYSDAWVDDARLVVLNAMLARQHGARIETRTACIKARREKDHWQLTLQDQLNGNTFDVTAKALVNATGPWVKRLFDEAMALTSPRNIRLVKGSHIIVPRIHEREEAYILQNEDKRIVFVIPYQQHFSLIGTTDLEYQGDPRAVKIDAEEVQYLCDVVNKHFIHQLTPDDVVWSYSGVRPLCDDESSSPQAVTRDYTLELSDEQRQTPLLSVFGGKLTTYRKLAQAACHKLAPYFPQMRADWTATTQLPGGNFEGNVLHLTQRYRKQAPWLDATTAKRIASCYGSLAADWLPAELTISFGNTLCVEEVDYLINQEWACTAEDILWRRTKLGLTLDDEAKAQLEAYVTQRMAARIGKPVTQIKEKIEETSAA
nr:glycerol-3-phosphate dehydrogenase [Tolumonas lignilytica]